MHDAQTQGLETAKRTRNNVREFCERLKHLREDIEVEVIKEHQPEKHDPTGGPVDAINGSHVWTSLQTLSRMSIPPFQCVNR
jgi:hypothetical protein